VARIIVLYQSAFTVKVDAVAQLVITILTVILYEVVKVKLRGWHTGLGPRASQTDNFLSRNAHFGVRQLFSVKITNFFLNNIWTQGPIWSYPLLKCILVQPH